MNIAIRGTGKFGQYVYNNIKSNRRYDIICFVDNDSDLWGSVIDGIPIVSPREIMDELSNEVDYILVAFVDSIERYKDIVVSDCVQYGFVKNRVLNAGLHLQDDLRTDRNIVWNDAEYLDKPILRSLETNVVDYCNLNCRGCSHFSNLFSKNEEVPFEIFCRDLNQISEHVYVNNFNLLGGEVLLSSRVQEYMKFARKVLPYSDIVLVSNGLLIPRQKREFFECCVENDIMISISGYKPTLLLEQKIRDTLEQHQVIYTFRNEVHDFGKNLDLTGEADIHEALARCRESKCHFLRNGRIYKCPFQALGNVLFEHYDIGIEFKGGIDIYRNDLNWEDVVDLLHNQPVDECRYCGSEERMEWRVENNPVLNDWVIKE